MKKTFRSGYIEKLDSGGILYERDVLSMLLSNAYGGKDMSETADKLLARFPGVKAIISSDLEEITAVDGVSESVALYLKTVGAAYHFGGENEITAIKDGEDFRQKIADRFSERDNEFAEFYLVNARGKVVLCKSYTSHSADAVQMQTDEFLSFLTRYKPYGLYVAHNHVNTSCRPSAADDAMTRKISLFCSMCNVKFFDHAIINSEREIFSYAQSGRLEEL